MANTIITPSIIAKEALMTLYESTIMGQLVWRDFDADFSGKVGDTITVRKPATFTVNEFNRASGIVVQDITEGSFPVQLNKVPDVSFAVTMEDLTLRVDDFSNRFVQPAAHAIAEYVDQKLLAMATDETVVTASVGTEGTPPTDPRILLDARKILRDNHVPLSDGNTYGVLTTQATANFLKDPLFVQYLQRGDTDGLQNASIGLKYQIDNFESANFPTTGASAGNSVVFHRDAFALVTRTPQAPMGVPASQVAIESFDGLGLRVVQMYDNHLKQDVISVDLLAGFKVMDPLRAVQIIG